MSNRFSADGDLDISRQVPSLPSWLENRHLHHDESVAWIRGPRWNPELEKYITHPGLFAAALGAGVLAVTAAVLLATDRYVLPVAIMFAILLFFGSVLLLAFANAYFTRLVVTNRRIFILQGYENCRSWNINRLPRSLVRYRRLAGKEDRSIDLDALQSMFGTASDKFTDAKAILKFGQKMDQILKHERDED